MARPVVSALAEELYASLGPWSAADGEATGWALLHLCEAHVKWLQPLADIYSDADDGTPGWASAMQPATAPLEWLPWIGQFVGVTVDTYQSEVNQRQQISDEQGQKRGTVSFLRSTVQRFLQGTQHVDITERDTNPYHLALRVYRGELAGLHYSSLDAMYLTYAAMDTAYATYADMTNTNEQALEDAAQAAKPAGLVMAITVTPGTP